MDGTGPQHVQDTLRGRLPAKKLDPLAGLEESRAHVSGTSVRLHDEQPPRPETHGADEIILAERLLRFAVEGIPPPSFDASLATALRPSLVSRRCPPRREEDPAQT